MICGRAPLAFSVGVVDRPLRQPGAQRRKSREADRTVVDGLRVAQITTADGTVVRLERPVQESGIGHRAVRHETALLLIAALPAQPDQRLLDPLGTAANAGELRGPEALQELGRVWRLVRIVGIVEVELRIAIVRVVLVAHGRIDPLPQHDGTRHVRRLEEHGVGGNQPRAREVDRIPGRCVRDGRLLRLRLIEERERSSSRPSGDDDPLVPPDVLRVTEVRPEIEQDLLHDERRVVARIPTPRT